MFVKGISEWSCYIILNTFRCLLVTSDRNCGFFMYNATSKYKSEKCNTMSVTAFVRILIFYYSVSYKFIKRRQRLLITNCETITLPCFTYQENNIYQINEIAEFTCHFFSIIFVYSIYYTAGESSQSYCRLFKRSGRVVIETN